MKIIINDENLGWYFLPDSALANAGKPFFIPEFASDFEALLSPVVRINRIGKSIASRFAPRYYAEVAPAVHFRATRLHESLLANGKSADAARAFDRALIAGSLISIGNLSPDASFILMNNDVTVAEISLASITEMTGIILDEVSRTNTMKMGDLIAPVVAAGVPVSIGDNLYVCINNGCESLVRHESPEKRVSLDIAIK